MIQEKNIASSECRSEKYCKVLSSASKNGAEIETQGAEKKFEKKVRGGENVGKFINHKAEETLYKLNVFNFAFSLL